MAPATMRQRTHADIARASSEIRIVHMKLVRKIDQASQALSFSQAEPSRLHWIENRIKPGTQVMNASNSAMTESFPNTYSVRENGRQKYSGSALLVRSPETSPGRTNDVNRNAIPDWMLVNS